MVSFIISVRSKASLLYYNTMWDTVDSTIHSILGQKDDRFNIVVVCEENESKSYPSHEKISYVTHNFAEHYKLGDNRLFNYYTAPETQLELGCKNALALLHLQELSPDYVFFIDAADFVYESLVTKVYEEEFNPTGWEIKIGYALRDFRFRSEFNMSSITGSSFIINYKELTRNFDFDKLNSSELSMAVFVDALHPYFLREILGGGGDYDAFFHNNQHPIKQWPYSKSVVYNMGYTQATSSTPPLPKEDDDWKDIRTPEGSLDVSIDGFNILEKYTVNPYVPSK